jgi:cellulose synthase/poly-beta-1,6-N-acetylglucosamine synthase-like glycosyltransferase
VSRLLFWGGAATLAWTLVIFPALVVLRGTVLRRPHREEPITPDVTIVVSAHNEVASIGAKLESLLALDYPADRVEIIVASDGSDDGTNELVATFAARGVRLLALGRMGKAAALNTAVGQASGEILVLSDANSLFGPDALRALVAPFADAEVGGVAGDQRYLPADGMVGERSYWSFDRVMKAYESQAGHVISATGAIYAIRRSLFQPVPGDVTDDFVISTGVIEQGYRLVFAPDAVAFEPVSSGSDVEFGRKVRIATRGFRSVLARRALLDPRAHGFYALQLLSHKVLRRLMAIPLAAIALATVMLWRHGGIYQLAGLAQAAFYGLAGLGIALGDRPVGRHPILSLPAFFTIVNWAALLAALNVVRGRRIERWEPARAQRVVDTEEQPR